MVTLSFFIRTLQEWKGCKKSPFSFSGWTLPAISSCLYRRGAPDPGVSLGTLKTAFLSEITAVRISINKWCIEMSKVLLFWFLIMETYGNIQQNSKATHLKLTEKYGTHFHQIQFGAYIFIGKISISAVILKSIIWEFAWFWAKSKLYMIETNESCPYRDKV